MAIKEVVDLKVSIAGLPEQLEKLPGDVGEWESQLADCLNKQHLAEQALSLAKAQAEINIRTNPLAYGNLKLTESTVSALVVVQPEVIKAEKDLIDARLQVNSLKAITNALDVKRSACKYLAELTLSGRIS